MTTQATPLGQSRGATENKRPETSVSSPPLARDKILTNCKELYLLTSQNSTFQIRNTRGRPTWYGLLHWYEYVACIGAIMLTSRTNRSHLQGPRGHRNFWCRLRQCSDYSSEAGKSYSRTISRFPILGSKELEGANMEWPSVQSVTKSEESTMTI
jgi:hypothetical protein